MANCEYWNKIKAIRETDQMRLVDESKPLTPEERNDLKIGSLTLLSEILEEIQTNDPRILEAHVSDIQTHDDANMTGMRLRWGDKLNDQNSEDDNADYSWIETQVYGSRSRLVLPFITQNNGQKTVSYVRFHLATFVQNPFIVLPTVSMVLDHPFKTLITPSQPQELPSNMVYLFPNGMNS